MSTAKQENEIGINVLNGEVIAHIPKCIIDQFGALYDGQRLAVFVVNDEIVIKRKTN